MLNNYIDPTTYLPKNFGELYADKHIKIVGQARLLSGNLETVGVQIICSPIDGGGAAVTTIPDGSYPMTNIGDSFWVTLRRTAGTSVSTPTVYAVGTQPKLQKDSYQLFYKSTTSEVLSPTFIVSEGAFYTSIGYGKPSGDYNKIVGPGYFPSLTAASPVAGDSILITGGYTITSGEFVSANDLRIYSMPNVVITVSSSSFSGYALTLNGSGIELRNVSYDVQNNCTVGLSIAGNDNFIDNAIIKMNYAGRLMSSAFLLNAGAQGNRVHGLAIEQAGTINNALSDNSGNTTNEVVIRAR